MQKSYSFFKHLRKVSYKYKRGLAQAFPDIDFWWNQAEMIQLMEKNSFTKLLSFDELSKIDEIAFFINFYDCSAELKPKLLQNLSKCEMEDTVPEVMIDYTSTYSFLDTCYGKLLSLKYHPISVMIISTNEFYVRFTRSQTNPFENIKFDFLESVSFHNFSDTDLVFLSSKFLGQKNGKSRLFFNEQNKFTQWLKKITLIAIDQDDMILIDLLKDIYPKIINLTGSGRDYIPLESVIAYAGKWRHVKGLAPKYFLRKLNSKDYYAISLR